MSDTPENHEKPERPTDTMRIDIIDPINISGTLCVACEAEAGRARIINLTPYPYTVVHSCGELLS